MKKFAALFVALSIVAGPRLARCGSAGRISGRVTDAQTGEPLPGANVLIVGTSIGGSTDLNGAFTITNVPQGSYTVRVSYIGYRNFESSVRVGSGESTNMNFKLEAVGVKGRAVVVTAQASGQNAAINEELSSNQIMNAVSAARIRELPDQNAAESVARLPGVYLVRQGGEGTQLAVRGMEPQYSQVLIDGVQMASTSSSNRSVNLSMISSSSLSGVQLFKTAMPDMDAAFLGGVANFQLREAKRNHFGGPEVGLSAQGSYDQLQSSYNNYKLGGSIGDRFFGSRLGIFVQGIVQRIDLTSDTFGGSYYLPAPEFGKKNAVDMSSLTLTYAPSEQQLYDATVVMDYRLPGGKIDFMNFLSRGLTNTQDRIQSYDLPPSNQISFGASFSPSVRNVVTNLLQYQQDFLLFKMGLKLSNSYSEYVNPGSWSADFTQNPAGLNVVPGGENPVLIARTAASKVVLPTMDLSSIGTSNSLNQSEEITGSIDLSRKFVLSDVVTGKIKLGGMYRQTGRYYNYNSGTGDLNASPAEGAGGALAQVLQAYPWMTKPPYSIASNGAQPFPITAYDDPGFRYPTFLGGNYSLMVPTNFPLLAQTIGIVVNYMRGKQYVIASAYSPNVYASGAGDYSGNEYRSAGYVMATLNIGPRITIIPGVRYQALRTSYTGSRYFDASELNPYPGALPHQDTTIAQYHGYWLPDVTLRYGPLSWFQVRGSYTNTLAYPDFSAIIPRIDLFTGSRSITWNNYALKPAHSQNYDLALSFYSNAIGLFAVDGFLKQIDNFIFSQSSFITNPSLYPGVPAFANAYSLSTEVNDNYRVNLWGTEVDWETHFWYLPSVLSGLILNVNYTHIYSGAKYPYTVTEKSPVYPFTSTNVDTFYTDRLIDQPDDIVNLSLGYDYMGFSAIASMIFQSNVFSGTNFWPELRSYKSSYLRWDAVVKQDLPWPGLQVYLDLNDLNGASDIYVIQGDGFPTSESAYGTTADVGIRWDLE